jgi:hypothetical protein
MREVFEERFVMTYKQRIGLDKWPITEARQDGWQLKRRSLMTTLTLTGRIDSNAGTLIMRHDR